MMKIINRQAQKVATVTVTRGSYCRTLSGKILVFWIGGHLWEVIAYGVSTVFT